MRFYHNNELNLTAEEEWVVDYLYQSDQVSSQGNALIGLSNKREFYGWYECQVSNTIEEALLYD